MYRSIETKLWTDPKIRELAPLHKLLFIYLITNIHTHVSGIYYMPKVLIQHETGLSMAEVERGIDTLSKGYLCRYDVTTEVVWVRSMLRYQPHGEKIRQAVASQLHSLHNCQLIKEFLDEYAHINIPYTYPIDTVSMLAREMKEQETERETETEREQEQINPTTMSGNGGEAMGEEEVRAQDVHAKNSVTPEILVAWYNAETPPHHPKVGTLTPGRRQKAIEYLRLFPDPDFWHKVFYEVGQSPLLLGQRPSDSHKNFRGDFDWLLQKGRDKTENCAKTAEGKYRETAHSHLRDRTSPSQYRTIMAGQRFVERHLGTDRRTDVSGNNDTVIDCTQYRIE